MSHKRVLLFTAILIFTLSSIHAQSKKSNQIDKGGHELVFNIKDASDPVVYLAIHYRDRLLLKDSAIVSTSGKYVFKGDTRYDDGLYMLVSYQKKPYLDFIIDRHQHFEFFIDTSYNILSFSVKNSPQNDEMLSFQKKSREAQERSTFYQDRLKIAEDQKQTDSVEYYNNKFKELNDEMIEFINLLIDRNPDYLFSKMQKAYQPIKIPDPPVREDGTIDSTFQPVYYLTHFWDNVDLTDNRFIFLPLTEKMYNDYFNKHLRFQEADTINRYIDLFLEKVEGDSLMFRYFIERLTYQYESSKMIGHDAIFVHIAKNYHLKGKCTWLDEDILKKYQKRVNNLEPLLIGKKATELIIADTTGKRFISSHANISHKYVILWFFDPDCHTCKQESTKLKHLYDSLTLTGTRNFEVYAIGNDADTERWKKYVREKEFKWINVGGNVANVDFLSVYNIHETGNPTMFILDENRNIILNKRIDVETIPSFLEQHDKISSLRKK